MKTHELKTIPIYYDAVLRGDKTFEVRKNDRDFQTGDRLILQEWDRDLVYEPQFSPGFAAPPDWKPPHDGYTGRCMLAIVSYVLHDTWGQFGIERGYVVLGFDSTTVAIMDEVGNQ